MKKIIYLAITSICFLNLEILISTASAEPSFIKHYFIDASLTEIKDKYKGSLQSISCSNDVVRMCSSKNQKCSCYNVTLAASQFLNKNLLFVTAKEKVVLSMDRTQVEPRFYLSQLEAVDKWFEGDKPTTIYEDSSSQYGFQAFQLVWNLNDGYVTSSVTCPVNSNNKKGLYSGRLKDCRVRVVKMSRLDKFVPPSDLRISKLSY